MSASAPGWRIRPPATLPALMLAALLALAPRLAAAESPPVRVAPTAEERAREAELRRLEDEAKRIRDRQADGERRSREAMREQERLQARMIDVARSARQAEEGLSSAERRLGELEIEMAEKRGALLARRDQMSGLLGALQRVAIFPPEAMLLLPQPPLESVRGAMLMGAALPQLQDRARDLRAELDDLQRLEALSRAEKKQFATAQARLTRERRELDRLIASSAERQRRSAAEVSESAAQLRQIAASAHDLRDLLERLADERREEERRLTDEARRRAAEERARRERAEAEAEARRERAEIEARRAQAASAQRPPPADPRRAVAGAGARTPPASGKIVLAYGQPGEFGAPQRGMTIQTRPEAVVVAPTGGQIVFSGNFRTYGLLLIIEHRDGYVSLLSGLGRLDVGVGRAVAGGEPLGAMGRGGDGPPELYFELRRHGQPINPDPWLAPKG